MIRWGIVAKIKNKVYVAEHTAGEYTYFTNWPACQAFVKGKPFAFAGGVDRKSALDKLQATRDWQMNRAKDGGTAKGGAASKAKKKPAGPIPTEGICSDAGTHGNPGPCEYQVSTLDANVLEHSHLGVHTNNYAELAGIEAMLRYAANSGDILCWTDSAIAMGWIRSRRLGPTVKEPELILEMIGRINKILSANPQLRLVKWVTKSWGEIPADFGRK